MKSMKSRWKSLQRGSASVEYIVGTLAVIAALFAPLVNDMSAVGYLLEALRQFQMHSTYLLALP